MIVTVLIDVSITVMMCWALYRKRTGFKRYSLPFECYIIDLADEQS